jgi:hypothetical protein
MLLLINKILMLILIVLIILLLFLINNKQTFSKEYSSFSKQKQTIALISLIYLPKNIETWLEIHRKLGIDRFYIRLEDTPDLVEYLSSQPDVTLMVGSSSKDDNQYTTLQTRQTETMDKVIKLCKNDGIDFLIHIDCDEILEGDLDEIRSLPESVGTFWMQNHEAVYEGIPTKMDNCFAAKFYRNCGESNANCASYSNGKGGGRVSSNLTAHGPHRFRSNGSEVKLNNLIVKHYESCDFDQYIKKYTRLKRGVKMDDIPFPYYRESILSNGDTSILKEVYTKYRIG